jgi:glycosyltransferase involved in cell wall biosynthesis
MISVVMPAYNAARFIGEAVESILNQTWRELELLVIDDGSTDRTVEIVRGYAARDARVRVIESAHGGISRARNKGMELARYPWVAVMDADDVALPHRFERQLQAAAAEPQVVAWGAYVYHINSRGERLSLGKLGPTTVEEFRAYRAQGMDVNMHHPTALLRRDVCLEVGGYNPELAACVDFDLFDRLAAHGPIVIIPEPLLLYRLHLQSVTMSRFFTQRRVMRYVTARCQARLAGEREPSLEEFNAAYRRLPLWRRGRQLIDERSFYYYRLAGILYGEGQYARATAALGLSTLLKPGYVFPRLWKHKFSPEARRWLKTGGALAGTHS